MVQRDNTKRMVRGAQSQRGCFRVKVSADPAPVRVLFDSRERREGSGKRLDSPEKRGKEERRKEMRT
jgi:hypothetical protein